MITEIHTRVVCSMFARLSLFVVSNIPCVIRTRCSFLFNSVIACFPFQSIYSVGYRKAGEQYTCSAVSTSVLKHPDPCKTQTCERSQSETCLAWLLLHRVSFFVNPQDSGRAEGENGFL